VIDRFGEAIKLRDAHRREDEAAAIRGLVANTRSVILREGFPVKFNSILVSAEYVRRTHRLLVAILELDEFRQQHGRYPPTDGVQQRDYSEVGYRVAADGMSYTLAVEKPDGTVVSFARRHQ
jgi:hypothetical protein